MLFTQDEFDVMVDELLYQETVSYNMLCNIAVKFLGPYIAKLCSSNEALRGRGYEEDILQDVCLHLIKVTVDKFFLKKDDNGNFTYDRNPGTFGNWLKTVARNKVVDKAVEIGQKDNRTVDIESLLSDSPSTGDEFTLSLEDESTEMLRKAIFIVMSSSASVYKILTWLAQCVLVLNYDLTRIKANDLIVKEFEHKSLFDMYAMITAASDKISWLRLSDEQHRKIMNSLKRPFDDTRCYGVVKYREFFMKYRGEIAPKKSISDWINRMDSLIQRESGLPQT